VRRIPVLAAGLGWLLSVSVAGNQAKSPLQGVWQTIEVAIGGANPRTMAVADPRSYVTIFTAKYYSRTEVQTEGARPLIADTANATAGELRALWGPVVAEAGTYEISGDTITMHPAASKSPAAMAPGALIVSTFKIDGNTLWIAQQRNQAGPYASPVTFKLRRVE
jgi:hypothetical protein